MQIAHAKIENFRKIENVEIDFTDALGRVRDMTVLVGPNGAGKTTILDAIAAAIGPSTELPATRPSWRLSPRTVVRKGALSAKVTCQLRFSPEEIETAQKLGNLLDPIRKVPDVPEVELVWTYPDARDTRGRLGFTDYNPGNSWMLLKSRVWASRLLRTKWVDSTWFERAGRVYFFDQQRTQFGRTIRRDILRIIAGHDSEEEMVDFSDKRTSDPRMILLDLAVRASLPLAPGASADDLFSNVQQWYAQVCAPRKIIGAVQEDLNELDIRFSDGENEYGYDGVSSGESMVLLFLIGMISERIHQSIVLVDEIELHQHPVWQRRLLHLLPKMGRANQIITTTHSPYLRDVLARDAIIDVGELGDDENSADSEMATDG